MSRRLDRLVAWLCVVLFLGTGAVPSGGVVVCVEADGCVRFELKAPGEECRACDEHDEGGSSPATLASEEDDGGACPCFDLALPGSGDEQRTAPRTGDACVSFPLPPAPETSRPMARECASPRGPPARVPHVARVLLEIQSVVLRV